MGRAPAPPSSDAGVNRRREWRRASYERNRDATRKRMRDRYDGRLSDAPDYFRDRHFRRRYGLPLAVVADLLVAQSGRCFLPSCRREIRLDAAPRSADRAVVAHDGLVGEPCAPDAVRALLWHPCNLALGRGEAIGMTHPYLATRPHAERIAAGLAAEASRPLPRRYLPSVERTEPAQTETARRHRALRARLFGRSP